MARHFLLCGGVDLYKNYSLGDYVSGRSYIGNIGNFMFLNAVMKSMMIDEEVDFMPTWYRTCFTDEEVQFANSYYDAFVMPLADAFRDDNVLSLQNLTVFIRKLTIPCYVIGVGLRATYYGKADKNRKFDGAVTDFLKAVLDKSSMVGLRGANTAAYLQRLGFFPEKHFTVIGCPSVSVLVPGERIKKGSIGCIRGKLETNRIALITNTLAPQNVNTAIVGVIKNWGRVTVVAQKEMELENIYLGKLAGLYRGQRGIVENVFGDELYERLYRGGQIKTFSNLPTWISEISGNDLCISTRFHGAIAAMINRIPTVVIPFDSRMKELVDYHQLSSIAYDQITDDLAGQICSLDFNKYLTVWQRNREHYISFLNANSIENIFSKTYEDGVTPYDRVVKRIDWEPSPKNYSEIGLGEKLYRFVYYYGGKAKGKISKTAHSIIVK